MELDSEQRLEILKLEMQLIQGVFDKYDAMIFNSRNWFVTLWTATIGLGFTARLPVLLPMAAMLAILYWILEGLMRHQYWYKYVVRYRALRELLNAHPVHIESFSIYDLTHKYGTPQPSEWERTVRSFLKLEPCVLYTSLALAAVGMWALVANGFITFQSTNGT